MYAGRECRKQQMQEEKAMQEEEDIMAKDRYVSHLIERTGEHLCKTHVYKQWRHGDETDRQESYLDVKDAREIQVQ
jgi:hypothetical protein